MPWTANFPNANRRVDVSHIGHRASKAAGIIAVIHGDVGADSAVAARAIILIANPAPVAVKCVGKRAAECVGVRVQRGVRRNYDADGA
ncbi:MAG: hypothetical protein VXX72_09555 [Pseudomonadota bacterium]|nr:hypothetical protein [Pseudomonadota bacterium]